jgi:hypothetical protein
VSAGGSRYNFVCMGKDLHVAFLCVWGEQSRYYFVYEVGNPGIIMCMGG